MLDTWVTVGFHQMQAFKHAICIYAYLCWEIWSTSAGINTDPPFLLHALACAVMIFFAWLQANTDIGMIWNDALWRRSVCSVSFCLAWVQDLLVMALEFFKHVSSSQLWLWQGSVVKTHVHLTSVTTCYYPSWFSPKSGGRGQAQTARPRPFRPVWGLLPVPSSSSILLKIISLARWARMRV